MCNHFTNVGMDQRKWNFSFGLWTKIGLVIVFISVFNILVTFLGGLWENKSRRIVLSDLFIIEGILIFGLGTLVASGISILRMETWRSLTASPGGHVEYLIEQRRKQFSFGIMMMIIGATLICLSVVIIFFC